MVATTVDIMNMLFKVLKIQIPIIANFWLVVVAAIIYTLAILHMLFVVLVCILWFLVFYGMSISTSVCTTLLPLLCL